MTKQYEESSSSHTVNIVRIFLSCLLSSLSEFTNENSKFLWYQQAFERKLLIILRLFASFAHILRAASASF